MIKPYFETELGKLYHGDCLEILPQIEQVDLIVTSPPYGDLRKYKGYNFKFREIAKILFNITKQKGVVVWIIGDKTEDGDESCESFRQALFFKDLGFNLHDTMIYEKDGTPYPESNRYSQIFEYMFIFTKNGVSTFNPLKKTNRYRKIGVSTYRQKSGETISKKISVSKRGNYTNIWYIPCGYMKSTKDKIAYNHPAIFPDLLAENHIITWSNENDLIMDPMCGSGTVLKSAEKLNRRWIGIEISKEYCDIAVDRIKKETAQYKMDFSCKIALK